MATKQRKITKTELARTLGVSRTYITLLAQGKRQPGQQIVNKIQQLQLTMGNNASPLLLALVGKGGLEPPCLAAHDPKSIQSEYTKPTVDVQSLLASFLFSRRQGLSHNSMSFYKTCLKPFLNGYDLTPTGINKFLSDLKCSTGAKAYYFRAIRAFINWLVRNDHLKDNPLRKVGPPKPQKKILPSLTRDQVNYLIECVDSLRDKAIISLFADSGMRASELAGVKANDIDWETNTILIWGKGNKQRRAPFTEMSAMYLRKLVSKDGYGNNIWHLKRRGIQNMLLGLAKKTGLPCNPHTFRRTFASNLHRVGLDVEPYYEVGWLGVVGYGA